MTRAEEVIKNNKTMREVIEKVIDDGAQLEAFDSIVETTKLEVLRDISVSLAMIVDALKGEKED